MVDYKNFSKYKVTPDGKVFNKDGYLMSTFKDKDGYTVVSLSDDNNKKHLIKVHRLVATRYIPTFNYSLTVNHKDGNKDNNSVENLEWLSSADNLKHSWFVLGRKHYTKMIINDKGEVFKSVKEAAERYGASIQSISNCANGRTKTSKNRKWRYING